MQISTRMAIAVGKYFGATAILATAPILEQKKRNCLRRSQYTIFGILANLSLPRPLAL